MRYFISTFSVVIFIICLLIFLTNLANAQSKPQVKIIVLPQHEENFNKLISWLKKNHLFKDKVDFINSIKETFKSAEKADTEKYRRWLSIYKSELSKLNEVEKKELMDFILSSLKPVKGEEELSPMELPGGRCEANCLLTSCKTECLGGTKPKCKCEWFFADCGCEPYQP
ncbi:MAG: hypothetical protein ACK44H_05855 [Candidatus Kryptonium sp.]